MCAITSVCAALALPLNARAQEITVAPGDECLQGELGPYVAVWLREPAGPGVFVRVTVDDPRRHALTFTVLRGGAPAAERHLVLGRAPCQDIRTALSLAIAIAIDDSLLEALTGVHVEATPRAPPPLPPPPPPPTRRWAIPAEGYVFSGVVADVSGGLGLGVEFGPWRWLDLRSSFVFLIPQESPLGAGHASIGGALGRVDVCGRKALAERFVVRACAGGLFGARFAAGRGFDDPRGTNVGLATFAARLEAGFVLVPRSLELRVGADGYAFLTRPSLFATDTTGRTIAEKVFDPLGWSASVGVAILLE